MGIPKWEPPNAEALISRYRAGESEQALARESGVSRPAFRRFLLEHEVRRRGRGAAQLSRFQKASPEYRQLITQAAHDAVRGVPRSASSSAQRAATLQTRPVFAGRYEIELQEALHTRGLATVHQLALGKYNIDLAAAPIAIEVHNNTGYPHKTTRLQQRVKDLHELGWGSLYVMVYHRFRIDPIADTITEYVADVRTNGLRSPYRVITGSGKLRTSYHLEH